MKILQVIPYFAWAYGGPVKSVYELSSNLSEKGHDVTIFTTDVFRGHRIADSDKIKFKNNVKVRYFKCINNWVASEMKLHISPEMHSAIKNELKNFDVVHLHDYRSMTHYYLQHYSKKYGVPYLLQAHGASPKIYGKQSLKFTISKILFDLFFGRRILLNCSKVIALTKTEKDQYLEIGCNLDKIKVVPNGIRVSEYQELPKKGEFKKKYSIKNDEKIILYLGRIHAIKGIDLLVRSFFAITLERDNVKLVIVGPDDGFLPELKRQIADLRISNQVLYTGPLYGSEKLSAYVDCDFYVLPSIYETFPLTVLEAFACGKPVIVTDRCGISDFVEKAGIVVKYDEIELKNAINSLLNEDQLTTELGSKGKKLVETQFDIDSITENIISIYTNVLTE